MRVVFRERLDMRIQVFILFFCLTFIWLLSDFPWLTIPVGVFIYLVFGYKYYNIIFTDKYVEIKYPLLPFRSFKLSPDEIEVVSHVLVFQGALGRYKHDLVQIQTNNRKFQVSIYRDVDDFWKLNRIIHCDTWQNKFKTKGDAQDKYDIIKKRENEWNE